MAATQRLLVVLVLCSIRLGTPVGANNPPDILIGGLNRDIIIILENTTIGTILFNITARDPDSNDITIAVDGDETNELVTLDLQPKAPNERTARVLLKSRLDWDHSPRNRALWFKVNDEQYEIRKKVSMYIQDVNDNPPFFIHLPYRLELPERTNKTNSTVFTVNATDPDSGPSGTVLYTMTADAQGADELYKATFVMKDPRVGAIRLEKDLDYEKRNYYQYKVSATDSGTPKCPGESCYCNNMTEPNVDCSGIPAIFSVTVLDVQDTPPLFVGLPYITTLFENATINTFVLTVSALDGDRGVPNQVNYSIDCVASQNCPFSIDPHTGIIRVKGPGLDADAPGGQRYSLTALATEIQTANQQQFGETTASVMVSITVEDVNDNKPLFSDSVYYAVVQENTPKGVPITIHTAVSVEDKDQGSNSRFRLTLLKDGNPYYVFSTLPSSHTDIQGSASVMVSVNDSSMLDYEEIHNITFQIQAQESYTSEQFFSRTTVVLAIIDINDNSPRFLENQTTRINVTENSRNGTHLATFTATDEDSGDYGTIAYSLEDDFGGKFGISNKTGELSVQGPLDRESGDERFSLVVVAQDNVGASENQRRSARLNVLVMVQDFNDNPPIFQSHPSHVAVQENAELDTVLVTLKATDKDQGSNGDVRYQLVSILEQSNAPIFSPALFDIRESTGEVFVNASLIGHPGVFNVTFLASDRGEEPLNATTSVTVEVRDVNLNPPKFVDPDEDLYNAAMKILPNITILEEQPVNTFIKQLKASDADTGKNGLVHFYLDPDLNSAFLHFQVDPITGNLSNKVRLDCDGETYQYLLSLRAQDNGDPISLSKVIPFMVYLKDLDDNPPEFPQEVSTLVLGVKEMAAPVSVGFVNISTDKDRDPKNRVACYFLSGGQMLSSFTLNKSSGELRLLEKLDRTMTKQVTLQVKTTGNCSLPYDHFTTNNSDNSSNSGKDNSVLAVRVEVQDINNHPPVFNKDSLTVGLLYDVPVGTEITNLAAYTHDLDDTAEHSKHLFRLLQFHGPNSGSAESLDSTFTVNINGSVVTQRLFRADEEGNFVLTVQAYDVDNFTDTANLTIYLVSNLERVKLIFNKDPNEVLKIKADMVRRLEEILGMKVIVDKITTHIQLDRTADPTRTDVFVHARYTPSGKIVPISELVNAFDYNQKVFDIFKEYGVAYVSPLNQSEEKSDDSGEQKVFIIVILALAIVTVTLALVHFTFVRRYRRKLRAATTQAFVTTKEVPNNFITPGTNKYISENPLFGKDLKPDNIHRTEENDSDSLDDNEVDGGGGGYPVPVGSQSIRTEEPEEEQEIKLDMYDDNVGYSAQQPSHLAIVLREYDTHTSQTGENQKPAARASASMLGEQSEAWRPSPHTKYLNGLTPGHSNRAFDEDENDLQTTDI